MVSQSFQLVMRSGPTPGQVYELTSDEVYIGRGSANNIIIKAAEVSRRHVRLYQQGGEYMIEDLGSTNGTYIDGQRLIGPHLLRPGETIYLGENISLEVEAIYDQDATVVPPPTVPTANAGIPQSVPATQVVPEPEEPLPIPPYQAYPSPQPAQPVHTYSPPTQSIQEDESAPHYESDATIDDDESSFNWTWVFGGCGCMTLIFFALIVAALFWIDAGGEARWCQYLGFLFAACP